MIFLFSAKFLRWLWAFAGLILVGCQSSHHQWSLQSQASPTSIDFIELNRMTDNIRLMSQGRLDIRAVPSGVITGGPDIYTAVKEGRIEMGSGWPNWWSGNHPAWAVMNAGPFGFMNIDASLLFFIAGEGTHLANELSRPDGIIWRPAWWPGMEFGLLSSEPINGLADLKGKRVRIGPGLPSEVLAAASGAATIPLVPKEIRPALISGALDAVEWTTAAGAWDLGLGEIAPYAIVPAIWQPAVLADFLINAAAFNALPEDLQAILMTAIQSYTLTTTAKAKLQDFAALDKFRDRGTQITRWSPEDIDIWRAKSEQIYQQYRSSDPFTNRLLTEKHRLKERYDAYYQVFGAYE
ncbi:TRAP transporter substrate-binding protein DctP [Reinekea sp.]|jgi:TRAP-type mannitol/chloroaromatic compound transport system substrate-binding protein|uniref:TRAP transporter substrate-binding protein DctP n=1 Tax=Reinekea sp. TaxID=1970455 RepID=UPI002A815183|nr:TRAP transporter substrate-binding protein DctP [Reinekea sp.]